MIELRTLGTLELHGTDGRELRPILQQPKRLALLVYLALAGSRRFHRRDSLVALFWPELDGERARGALRRSLYFLRRSLGSAAIVGRGDEEVAVAPDVLRTDVARFTAAIAEDRLPDALELYRGDLLHGLYIRGAPDFEHWLDGERTRLRDAAAKSAWTLADRCLAQHEPGAAAHWARWAAALTPYDERAHRELVTILQRTGDRAGALRAHEEFTTRLRDDYEMTPSAETAALVQWIRTAPAPAAATVHAAPSPRAPSGAPAAPAPERSTTAPRGATAPRVLAVLPFTVRGSRELAYLGEGMVDLLSTTLDDAGDLRTVDPRALLSHLGREEPDVRDPDVACRTASHFGAGMFLLGSIVEAGGRLRITATLYDERCSIRATAEASGGGEAGLFDMVDQIARQLLARESDAPGSRLRRLGALTTAVLPALKAYLRGEGEFRAGRYYQALEHFQNAAAEDRGFALAYYRLSASAAAVANLPLAREAIAQARLHGSKLADHDRLLIEAQDAWLRGAADAAERLYREVLATHVDDLEAWFLLGDVLFHHNSLRGRPIVESRAAFLQTLRFDPDHLSALVHLARLAALEEERTELDRLVDRVLALSPAGDRALSARALRAFTLGNQIEKAGAVAAMGRARAQAVGIAFTDIIIYAKDHDSARRLAQLFARMSRGTEERALCHLVLAHLELASGDDAAAAAQLDTAASLDRAWSLELRALFAVLPFRDVPGRELKAVLEELDSWDASAVAPHRNQVLAVHNGLHPILRVYLMGLVAARLGDFADASRSAAELDGMSDPRFATGFVAGLARGVRAQVQWREGNAGRALATLEGIHPDIWYQLTFLSPFYAFALERFTRGQILVELGRGAEARAWLEALGQSSPFELIYVDAARRMLPPDHAAPSLARRESRR